FMRRMARVSAQRAQTEQGGQDPQRGTASYHDYPPVGRSSDRLGGSIRCPVEEGEPISPAQKERRSPRLQGGGTLQSELVDERLRTLREEGGLLIRPCPHSQGAE